ncbi:glycosyltransferase family 20-domain-containing protein [Pisolithus albus]|nr:glycosyltransferase family 20-domain-containing protein [Pisolithus albus]
MKLGVRRDKLDEIQCVRRKVEAFERLLKANPKFQGKLLGRRDTHFNSAFSPPTYQPVVFLHVQEVTFSPYLVLLTVADAFTVTSLRQGMALRMHEYVECQEGRKRAAMLSQSCFAVNLYDTHGSAKVIYQALTMPNEEPASRWQDLCNHVATQTAQTFVTSFLTRWLRTHTEHVSLSIGPSLVPPLDLPRPIPKYRHSTSRPGFVDPEVWLWVRDMSKSAMIEMMRSGKGPMTEPPEATTQMLEKLADDPKNEIWILRGLPTRGIGKKSNGQANGARWINLVANLDCAWKGPCIEILNYFAERTPGSFVEERATSIVWRFWTIPPSPLMTILLSPLPRTMLHLLLRSHYSDRSWARHQAAEAQNHILDSLRERYGFHIVVLLNNISRSTAVGTILHLGGPACSPLGGSASVGDADYDGYWSSAIIGSGAGRTTSSTGGRVSSAVDSTLVLAIGGHAL